jgi:hypothetical protein
LPLVVAADRRQVQLQQAVGGLGRLEGTRQQVSQVHHDVDGLRRDVGHDGVERRQVAVHIGEGGDPHVPNLPVHELRTRNSAPPFG